MNVLFIVSECVPFAKSGGLGDVAGALPKELKKLGADVRVLLPKYGTIPASFFEEAEKIAEFRVKLSWRNHYCGIWKLVYEGITYYFLDNEFYFKRPQLYGQYDDGERFAYFSRAAIDALSHISFIPDVIHTHDWHTGMIPFLLKTEGAHEEALAHIKTVFTIHNLQFQGIYKRDFLGDVLGVNDDYFHEEQLEFHGELNFMKAGIVNADLITTVSPTYKNEIQTAFFGEKLDGLLRANNSKLYGIVNGIDHDIYNPAEDIELAEMFTKDNLSGKKANKRDLQKQFGLPLDEEKPLIAIVSRLTRQKGFELVRHVFHEIIASDVQMIILGTGEQEFEHFFSQIAYWYSDRVKTHIGFNEELAHKIYAGADLFLMPSQFEPCGLSQLIAMCYGTVPIVRETGGLIDTVMPYNEYTGEGTGFSFTNFNAHDMLYTIRKALDFYHQPNVWEKIVKNAMSRNFSWSQSAKQYLALYTELIERK